MKRTLLFLLLFPATAGAVQFYADTALSVPGQCGIFLDTAPKVVTPTVLVGTVHTCKYDVSGVSNGPHTIAATAIGVSDPIWGAQESAPSAPFAFSRPATPTAPGNARLGP